MKIFLPTLHSLGSYLVIAAHAEGLFEGFGPSTFKVETFGHEA